MNKTTATVVSFGKFDRLTAGDDCNGKDVFINGVKTGRVSIVRNVTWKHRSCTSAYNVGTVAGYLVTLGDDETTYATLGQAHAAIKAYLIAQPIDAHIAECCVAMARAIVAPRRRSF